MATGKVKWFNNQKGYGFICADETNEEIFAHFSSIVMEGYKSLKAGQKVDFNINQGPKGLHALNITLSETIVTSPHSNEASAAASENSESSSSGLDDVS